MNDAISRILLVDDHPLLRRGMRQLLDMAPRLETVAEAGDGHEALRLALEHTPDLIVLDLNMQGMTGIDTLRALREAGVAARVVVLTVSDSGDDVIAALQAGADGYLLKDMEPEDLLAQIRRAANGELVVSPQLSGVMARALRPTDTVQDLQTGLTPRERQILSGIARGFSNKMIARELSITEGTTKVHVRHLLKKLGLRSRVEAAVWAVKQASEALPARHAEGRVPAANGKAGT